MTPVRLGAVGYLNARPLVFGLDRSPRFDLRYDLPSECARLLHAGDIDLGLIPSIEYLRGDSYRIVPDLAITSSRPGRVRGALHDASDRRRAIDRDGHQLADVGCAGARAVRAAVQDSAGDRVARPGSGRDARSAATRRSIIGDKALLCGCEHGPAEAGHYVQQRRHERSRRKPDLLSRSTWARRGRR